MMFGSRWFRQISFVAASAVFVGTALSVPTIAETLQGTVEREDTMTRLARPQAAPPAVSGDTPLRIERPQPAPPFKSAMRGLVDTSAFNAPLKGTANQDNANLGLLKPAQFGNIPNSKFDLGADRNSRELTLAWEAWHHQLSKEIYGRWSSVASVPGAATLRITVSKGHTLTPVIVKSSGNQEFDGVLLSTIMSLNGNPGLSFPAKSERQTVSFEADYVAATDIQPGYSWVKNDYEHVKHDE